MKKQLVVPAIVAIGSFILAGVIWFSGSDANLVLNPKRVSIRYGGKTIQLASAKGVKHPRATSLVLREAGIDFEGSPKEGIRIPIQASGRASAAKATLVGNLMTLGGVSLGLLFSSWRLASSLDDQRKQADRQFKRQARLLEANLMANGFADFERSLSEFLRTAATNAGWRESLEGIHADFPLFVEHALYVKISALQLVGRASAPEPATLKSLSNAELYTVAPPPNSPLPPALVADLQEELRDFVTTIRTRVTTDLKGASS